MGRSTERQVEAVNRDGLGAMLEQAERNGASDKAMPHVDLAITTLAKVMRGKKVSPSAKVSAAREVLAQAYGKPTQQVVHSGDGGGFHVQIIHFSTGQREEHVIDVPVEACQEPLELPEDSGEQ